MADDPAQAALAALDAALARRPNKDGHDFAQAATCLAAFRDQLIARQRASGDAGEPLARLNGIISVVVGAHFPLDKIPWPGMEAARHALAELAQRLPL